MKIKQLEALRSQHKTNLNRKPIEEPSLNTAIAMAIISGQPIKLRSAADVMASARKVIAECQCGYSRSERTLKFSEVFAFQSSELSAYQAAKKKRDAMIRAYTKVAERILRRSEVDESFDASDASDALAAAADDAGLME